MDSNLAEVRLLHIDDSFDFRARFKASFEREGLIVLNRRDSQEALGLLPGQDFDALVVDGAGFEYARKTGPQLAGAPLIVLSVDPGKADFPVDAVVSKTDPAWPAKVLALITNRRADPVPPGIRRSQQAFERDLNDLLKTHYRQWVAYHGDERVGIARSQTALFRQCRSRGLKDDELVVRSIEPPLADQDVVFPVES
jgi:hypothetical protein